MKWWKQLVLAVGAIILGAGLFIAYRTSAKSRDLRETLLWIDQTYNPHEGDDNFGQGHGWEIHYVRNDDISEKFGMTLAQNGSCNIVLHDETPAVGVFSETSSVSTYTFSLCDVDPDTIKIKTVDSHNDVFDCADPEEVRKHDLNCDTAEIIFETRNGAPAVTENYVITFVKLTGSEHQARGTTKVNKAWLLVDDPAYAKRLAQALKHAVELCGGKASTF